MLRRLPVALAAVVIGVVLAPVASGAAPADAPLIDPGVAGPQPVDELSYDLGDQVFKPVGFPAKVEIKAKVYAPQTITGRAPLVILQHGRHGTCATDDTQLLEWPCPAAVPEIPSYQGYDALGQNLASHGMVVVSISANGINANDGYLDDGGASARAQLILEHLGRWKAWDASATGSPFGDRFVGHIDLDRVGLMGHSRGGEGIAAAVQLNQRIGSPYGIKAALALAPVDFGRRVIGGVNLGVILPYCDGDVSDLQGANYYDDGRYASPGDTTSKMTALLYGANHNFFNTVWTTGPGSGDDTDFLGAPTQRTTPAPDPCKAGGAARLTAAEQEQAGATLMAGFFRRHLEPEPGLQRFVTGTAPFPASTGSARWSIAYQAPDRLDVATWATPASARVNERDQLIDVRGPVSGLVCNPKLQDGFGRPADVDVVTTACPSADPAAAVNDTGVLDVGWVRTGSAVRQIISPEGVDVSGYDGLRMRVAVDGDARNAARPNQDFSVVLEDFDGARASVAASTGTNGLRRLDAGIVQHALLNGLRLPLSSFSTIDLTRVKAVELRFDRTDAGRVSIADLAFTQEGTGAAAANTTGPTPIPPDAPTCRASNARRWACALTALLWGRNATDDEVGFVAAGYPTADGRRRAISALVSSAEARDVRTSQFVQPYIEDELDLEWIRSSLSTAGRRTWEAGTVDLAGSFASASGAVSTPAATVQGLYQVLLGRPADPQGLAYWTPKVGSDGASALAASLLRTTAGRGRVVDERYQQILGRQPDAAGRAYWVGRLATWGGEQSLVASLLATESFRVAATR